MALVHECPYPDRPTLVFLHDSLGCIELWRDFPEKLSIATRCNILVYDRLGYGRSEPMVSPLRSIHYLEEEADILNDLLRELKIGDAILFGHSDGGSIALIAASKYPQGIKAVICEAGHIFVEEITLRGIYNAIEAYKTTDLPQRLQKYHGNKVDTLFQAWAATWTRDEFRNWNIEHFLAGIECPLLFVQGDADEYGTLDQVGKTVGQVSGKATTCILPGVGHTPHKEAAIPSLEAAQDFINNL